MLCRRILIHHQAPRNYEKIRVSQVGCHGSQKPHQFWSKINFLFLFVYDSDPTIEHFSGLANLRNGWLFSNKSYWDFLSIFSDDFFTFSHKLWPHVVKIKFSVFLYMTQNPPKNMFMAVEKSESKVGSDLGNPKK